MEKLNIKGVIGNQTSSAQGTGRESATSIRTPALTPASAPSATWLFSAFLTYQGAISRAVALPHVYVLTLYLFTRSIFLSVCWSGSRAFQLLVQPSGYQNLLENNDSEICSFLVLCVCVFSLLLVDCFNYVFTRFLFFFHWKALFSSIVLMGNSDSLWNFPFFHFQMGVFPFWISSFISIFSITSYNFTGLCFLLGLSLMHWKLCY